MAKREILFRGKRTYNGKWIEGYLLEQNIPDYHSYIVASFIAEQDNRHTDIIEFDIYDVIPETVGQYTGLTDKNGVKIFEGDIIRFKDNIGYVIYTDDDASFLVDSPNRYIAMDYSNEFEIIGNIHDNPELMKGDEE